MPRCARSQDAIFGRLRRDVLRSCEFDGPRVDTETEDTSDGGKQKCMEYCDNDKSFTHVKAASQGALSTV